MVWNSLIKIPDNIKNNIKKHYSQYSRLTRFMK